MKDSLKGKLKSGIDKVSNFGKTLGLAAAIGTSIYSCVPTRQYLSDHNYGASFENESIESRYGLEEKVIEHPVTGTQERQYVHRIEPTNEDQLILGKGKNQYALAAMDAPSSKKIINTQGELKSVTSDLDFEYERMKNPEGKYIDSLVIEMGKKCEPCPSQEGSYISTQDIQKRLPNFKFLDLKEDGKYFLIHSKDTKVHGQTDYMLIPETVGPKGIETLMELDEKNGKLTFVGEIYKGYDKDGKSTIYFQEETEKTPMVASKLGAGNTTQESTVEKTELKDRKPSSSSFILGANTNQNFNLLEGKIGGRYGPFAAGFDIGKSFDKKTTETQTEPSQLTGNYGYGKITQENTLMFGPFAELHFLSNKTVSPFLGAKINFSNNELKITEGIKNSEGNWKPGSPNINTANEKNQSLEAYVGFNFKNIGLSGGYDFGSKEAKFGIRANISGRKK